MIYIAIDHINGEMQEVVKEVITNKQIAKQYNADGFIIIEINIKTMKVREWKDD